MKSEETTKRARELIERAKLLSKEKMIEFIQEQFGMQPELCETVWSTPIVPSYEYETIFPLKIDNLDGDELREIIDECVESGLGDEPMAVILINDIVGELPFDIIAEYDKKVDNGEIELGYNSIVIYDEQTLIHMYEEHLEEGIAANFTKEQVEEIFLKDIEKHFIHERMHLFTNGLIITYQDSTELGFDDYSPIDQADSEVLLDTVARMISAHESGDSIEDDFEKTLKERQSDMQRRGVQSYYLDKEDTLVTTMFALFPQELSRWIMFEAGDTSIPNKFILKCDEVLGPGPRARGKNLFDKVKSYFNKSCEKTSEQYDRTKRLLELAGVESIDLQHVDGVGIEQLRDLAVSEQAMEEINNGAKVVQRALDDPDKQKISNI